MRGRWGTESFCIGKATQDSADGPGSSSGCGGLDGPQPGGSGCGDGDGGDGGGGGCERDPRIGEESEPDFSDSRRALCSPPRTQPPRAQVQAQAQSYAHAPAKKYTHAQAQSQEAQAQEAYAHAPATSTPRLLITAADTAPPRLASPPRCLATQPRRPAFPPRFARLLRALLRALLSAPWSAPPTATATLAPALLAIAPSRPRPTPDP